jgi:hypothetical protein
MVFFIFKFRIGSWGALKNGADSHPKQKVPHVNHRIDLIERAAC